MAIRQNTGSEKFGEDVENSEPYTGLVGMENGVTALNSSLVVPQKSKHGIPICMAALLQGVSQEKWKHTFPQKLAREFL